MNIFKYFSFWIPEILCWPISMLDNISIVYTCLEQAQVTSNIYEYIVNWLT